MSSALRNKNEFYHKFMYGKQGSESVFLRQIPKSPIVCNRLAYSATQPYGRKGREYDAQRKHQKTKYLLRSVTRYKTQHKIASMRKTKYISSVFLCKISCANSNRYGDQGSGGTITNAGRPWMLKRSNSRRIAGSAGFSAQNRTSTKRFKACWTAGSGIT